MLSGGSDSGRRSGSGRRRLGSSRPRRSRVDRDVRVRSVALWGVALPRRPSTGLRSPRTACSARLARTPQRPHRAGDRPQRWLPAPTRSHRHEGARAHPAPTTTCASISKAPAPACTTTKTKPGSRSTPSSNTPTAAGSRSRHHSATTTPSTPKTRSTPSATTASTSTRSGGPDSSPSSPAAPTPPPPGTTPTPSPSPPSLPELRPSPQGLPLPRPKPPPKSTPRSPPHSSHTRCKSGLDRHPEFSQTCRRGARYRARQRQLIEGRQIPLRPIRHPRSQARVQQDWQASGSLAASAQL